MNNQNLITWLLENIQRLFTKSPKFFRIWQTIALVLVLLTGVPELLTYLDVYLPEPWNTRLSKVVLSAASGILFMSKLSTQSPAVAVMKDGTVLKETEKEKLPFTAAVEEKAVEKIIEKTNGSGVATMVTVIEQPKT